MKAANVRIGGEYLTRVSGELVRVRVTGTKQVPYGPICIDGKKTTRTAFEVERVDLAPERPTKRRLSPRSAAALRPVNRNPQYFVKGRIELSVGGESRVLAAGDAYYFKSSIPHHFRNPGREECEIVSASSPPTF